MPVMRSFHLDDGTGRRLGPEIDTARLLLRAMRCALLCIDMPAGIPRGIDCRAFLMLMAIGSRRRIRVAPVDVDRPTVQERHLIELIAAAQADDRVRLDHHLTTLVVPAWRDAVRAAVIDLAGALLEWAPAIPQGPMQCYTTAAGARPVPDPNRRSGIRPVVR